MAELKKIIVVTIACALTLFGAVSCAQKASRTARPNFVVIMCDDQSLRTISAYEGALMQTPSIDVLASEGTLFTNSFTANSACGSSLESILTGRHPLCGKGSNGNTETLSSILKEGGYETAIVGKWSMRGKPSGFDHWDILCGGEEYYNPAFESEKGREVREGYVTNLVTDAAIKWLEGRSADSPFFLFINNEASHRTWMPDTCDLGAFDSKVFPLPDNFHDSYKGRRADLLQKMGIESDMNVIYDLKLADPDDQIHTPDSPRLESMGRGLYLGIPEATDSLVEGKMNPAQQKAWSSYYSRVIENFKMPGRTAQDLTVWKYQRFMRDYCSVTKSVDRNVGRLYSYLKEHGLLENTVIIYTSDHGIFTGEHGWFGDGFMYEESMRIPLIVRTPSSKGGSKVGNLVQNIDYAPTILSLAGLAVPEGMQGEDLSPLLGGKTKSASKAWRSSLYYQYCDYPGEYSVCNHYGVRTERYSLMHFYGAVEEWELFDLQSDPSQMRNIYGEPGTVDLTQPLKEELSRLRKLYGAED